MIDRYKHEPADISTIVGMARGYIANYKSKIIEITNVIKEIDASNAWIDAKVKTAFIQTSNSYIKIFNQVIDALEKYINYLEGKSSDGESVENSFARVIVNGK